MSQNYLRACHIFIAALGKTYTCDFDSIRLRFSIKQATVAVPNTATIRLTNMNRKSAEQLCKNPSSEGTFVSISAGYQGNEGMIFQGHIVRPIYGRENPTDTLCQILCTDGNQAMSHATVNKALPPGSTPKDHLNVAIQAMKKYGVNLGFVGPNVDLSTPTYPRSVSLFGMARQLIDDIAHSKGATWGIQNLAVNMLKPSDSIPGGAFELNSQTGLIGMPTLTPDGVYVRTLINPQMKIDSLVHIDQSLIQGYLPSLGPTGEINPQFGSGAPIASIAADGIYRIVKIDVEGDTRGQPWYMDMLVLKPGETTPVSIDAAGGQARYTQ
jgi:hypothetical protein